MTEDFGFVPDQIANFGRFMDASLGQTSVTQAKRYADTHLTTAGDKTGLFGTFAATADQVQDNIAQRLTHISNLLTESGQELIKLDKAFYQMNITSAGEINTAALQLSDSTYVTWEHYDDYTVDTRSTPLHGTPQEVLTPPCNDDPIPFAGDFILNQFWNFSTLSGAAMQIATWINGNKNPGNDILKHIAGDWNNVALGSDALAKLGKYHQALAAEIDTKFSTLRNTWKGQSAEAANSYFDKLVDAIDDMLPALQSVSSEYHSVAYGMYSEAQAIAGIIPLIEGLCWTIALDMALAGAFSWTGVGAAIALGSAAVEITAVLKALWTMYQILGRMVLWINAFVGFMAGFLGTIHSVDTINAVKSVDNPYDSPFI
jgi:uncharacterized protein YukE